MPRAGITAGVLALCFAVLACAPAADAVTPPRAQCNGLTVDLIIATPKVTSLSELKTTVKLTNDLQQPMQLNTTYIGSQIFFFKLRDEANNSFTPTGTPPTPINDDGKIGRITLAPHQSTSFTYTGLPFADLKPGKYQLRFDWSNVVAADNDWRGEAISNWVDFTVLPANDKTWTKSKN